MLVLEKGHQKCSSDLQFFTKFHTNTNRGKQKEKEIIKNLKWELQLAGEAAAKQKLKTNQTPDRNQ